MSKLVILTLELTEAKALLKELVNVPLAIDQRPFGEGLRKLERAIQKHNNGHSKMRQPEYPWE